MTMPTARNPAAAIGLAIDPAEVHRQFAFFKADAGPCRSARRVTAPGNTMQRAAAPKSAQPRNRSDVTNLNLVPSPKPS